MRLLVDEIQFSVVSDVLVTASSEINRLKDPVLLLCEPTILGSLSISGGRNASNTNILFEIILY